MRFTALKISNGDSYLLETDGRNFLVDTGGNANKCYSELRKKKIKCLNAIAITHFHKDHYNGLMNILKSNNIEIKEIWLPERISSIYQAIFAISEGDSKISKSLRDYLQDLTNREDAIHSMVVIFMLIDARVRDAIFMQDKELRRTLKAIRDIYSAVKIANCNIRWFAYTGSYRQEPLGSNFFALNSLERKPVILSNDIELLYFLDRINHESLVFKYSKDGGPDILFTSDSGFDFYNSGTPLILQAHSIMTAPHHGSNANENVYDIVQGSDIIYVRSDFNKVTRISRTKFIDSDYRKFCTLCRVQDLKPLTQEVILNNNGCTWEQGNGTLACQCNSETHFNPRS